MKLVEVVLKLSTETDLISVLVRGEEDDGSVLERAVPFESDEDQLALIGMTELVERRVRDAVAADSERARAREAKREARRAVSPEARKRAREAKHAARDARIAAKKEL